MHTTVPMRYVLFSVSWFFITEELGYSKGSMYALWTHHAHVSIRLAIGSVHGLTIVRTCSAFPQHSTNKNDNVKVPYPVSHVLHIHNSVPGVNTSSILAKLEYIHSVVLCCL